MDAFNRFSGDYPYASKIANSLMENLKRRLFRAQRDAEWGQRERGILGSTRGQQALADLQGTFGAESAGIYDRFLAMGEEENRRRAEEEAVRGRLSVLEAAPSDQYIKESAGYASPYEAFRAREAEGQRQRQAAWTERAAGGIPAGTPMSGAVKALSPLEIEQQELKKRGLALKQAQTYYKTLQQGGKIADWFGSMGVA